MDENTESQDGSFLLKTIQLIAMKPDAAMKLVKQYRKAARKRSPSSTDEEVERIIARRIINRYSKYAAISGGATSLTGVVPGLGTALAMFGGGVADTAVSMKLQVDMTMCLAANYGWDLTDQDAQHLTLLIAVLGSLEKFGVQAAAPIASKAGVVMLRTYLRGAALVTIKELLKKFGVTFTRKALEKAVPFGFGVATSSSINYALTQYVGYSAVKCFTIDRVIRKNPAAEESDFPSDL